MHVDIAQRHLRETVIPSHEGAARYCLILPDGLISFFDVVLLDVVFRILAWTGFLIVLHLPLYRGIVLEFIACLLVQHLEERLRALAQLVDHVGLFVDITYLFKVAFSKKADCRT